ncbi:MAG: hypothetical protein JSV20_03230, partial [Candidatus Bathyarchaeota archaeon]
MEINTKELVLATILGAIAWVIKVTMPGIPLDFAIPGAKIDLGWTPAILAAIWLGVKGGLITGVFMSLVPIPTLFLTGLLFTPWPLAVTGYLARTRGWDWKAALIFPLLHVPFGVAIYTWIIPVFTFFVWSTVLPAILLTEYVSALAAS